MADFDKLVENFFKKKELIYETNELNVLIKEMFKLQEKSEDNLKLEDNPTGLKNTPQASTTQKSSYEEIIKLLPKFEFLQAKIGMPGTPERRLLAQYFGDKIKADSFVGKIQAINNLANINKPDYSPVEVLRKLMILKILENAIYGYYGSSAGYNFEAFFAALMSDDKHIGQQIPANKGGLKDVEIEIKDNNVKIGSELYQLKMLSRKEAIKLSPNTVKKFLGINDALPSDKQKTSLNETQNNNLNLIVGVKGKTTKEIVFYQSVIEAQTLINKLDILDKQKEKAIKANNTKAIEELEKEKIVITIEEYTKGTSVQTVTLSIQEKTFIELSKLLEEGIKKVLKNVSELIDNVNTFYLNTDTNAASNAASNGIGNANNISTELTRQSQTK
jgi:hypothetical protein